MTDKNGSVQITIPPGAYEFECLNEEIKGYFLKTIIIQKKMIRF